MKKLITAIAIGALTFAGTATQSDARPHSGHGYGAPRSTVYVSGHRHGRPVYTEKYFVGYDRCGSPRFAYRTVSAPHGSYGGDRCSTGYPRGYHQPRYTQHGGYYGNHRSSGSGVSLSFSLR